MTISVLAVTGACAPRASSDGKTASEIERQVVAAHPDVVLNRFARFYARKPDGSVTGIWVYANEGYDPIVGKAGQSVWSRPEDLPAVNDGGCGVLTISYDPEHKRLESLECGAPG